MMRIRGPHRTLSVLVVVACVALVNCGGSDRSQGRSVPATTASGAAGPARAATTTTVGTTTTVAAKASRAAPLAERVFRVDPEPTAPSQVAAVRSLKGYLDAMVTAFATNDLTRGGVRRFTSPQMYAAARRLVAEQIQKHYVLYGPWWFTIQPQGATSRAAVIGVCIDQSRTRRHDAKTDAAGRRNDTPYVQLSYTLNRLETGWLVVDDAGRRVSSCPG